MTFFSDERANELRNLFFESAHELLQALNEDGLRLEKEPANAELVRNVRRCVHTLKGDSAACGYTELAELAHRLEDILTSEVAAQRASQLADVILNAADTFDGMLSAYRDDRQPPQTEALRSMIERVANPESAPQAFAPTFAWTEYDRLLISQNAVRGQNVYNVGLRIDPQCPMRAAALQLIKNVMQEVGTVLVMRPDDQKQEIADSIEAALASHHPSEWITKKCTVPAVVSEIVVQLLAAGENDTAAPVDAIATAETDLLGLSSAAPMAAAPAQATPAEAPAVKTEEAIPAAEVKQEAKPEPKKAAAAAPAPQQIENMLRVEAERIDTVLDLVGELIIGKSMIQEAMGAFAREFPRHPLRNQFADAMAFQSQVLGNLQRSVMKIRMVPVEQLFRRFPRVLRDAAKVGRKEVELVMRGEDTDLDKSILDALSEPLTHLVRNAVAHGIESPEERIKAGKPAKGTVTLNAYHQGNQVVVEISDDGRGIDRTKIVRKAIEKGVITEEEVSKISESDALNLIFQCGFSTAEKVTELSGRGVGMDVVKTVMERLKGSITIDTTLGVGTTFQLKLPLTLAIIKALLFRVCGKLYAVPLGSVLEITRANATDIHIVDGHEVVNLRDEWLTLVRVSALISKAAPEPADKVFVVVVAIGHRRFGLIVDRLAGEQELVIKALDGEFITTEVVSGASVLGDGRVVLILDIAAVVQRAGHLALTRAVGAHA